MLGRRHLPTEVPCLQNFGSVTVLTIKLEDIIIKMMKVKIEFQSDFSIVNITGKI